MPESKYLLLLSLIFNVLLFSYLTYQENITHFFHSKSSCPYSMNIYESESHPQKQKVTIKTIDPNQLIEQKLTDIVMPFHSAHIDRVQRNLATWVEYPPCHYFSQIPPFYAKNSNIGDEQDFYYNQSLLGRNMTLTFALSSPRDDKIKKKLRLLFEALPVRAKQCFQKVRIVFKGLKGRDDAYLAGTRYMFEALLNGTIGLEDPQYVLYMEPDMLPVRPYWLTSIDASIRRPAPPFWVKGSLYRGGNKKVMRAAHYAMHINGNAIYNLGDPLFRSFYYNMVKPNIEQEAYDLDIAKYLLNRDNWNATQKVAHKFQYTDMIQNWWRWGYSRKELRKAFPNLYLVHGGLPQE